MQVESCDDRCMTYTNSYHTDVKIWFDQVYCQLRCEMVLNLYFGHVCKLNCEMMEI